MPKVLFPRNIKKGIFASLNFTIGPFTISLIQLVIMAVGIAGFLGIFQAAANSGVARLTAALLALPVLLIFAVVAFFKISELSLIPFLAKLIRTNFFDANEKFQVDYPRFDNYDLLIHKQKHKKQKKNIEKKRSSQNKKAVDTIQDSGLL